MLFPPKMLIALEQLFDAFFGLLTVLKKLLKNRVLRRTSSCRDPVLDREAVFYFKYPIQKLPAPNSIYLWFMFSSHFYSSVIPSQNKSRRWNRVVLLFVNWYGVILFGSATLKRERSCTWIAALWIGLAAGGGGRLCSSQRGGHRSHSRLKLDLSQEAELYFCGANFSWLRSQYGLSVSASSLKFSLCRRIIVWKPICIT